MKNEEHKYEIGIEMDRWKDEEFGIRELQDAYAEALTKIDGLDDLLCHIMNLHESKLELEFGRLLFDMNHREDIPIIKAVAYKYDIGIESALFLITGLFLGWRGSGNIRITNKAGKEVTL